MLEFLERVDLLDSESYRSDLYIFFFCYMGQLKNSQPNQEGKNVYFEFY